MKSARLVILIVVGVVLVAGALLFMGSKRSAKIEALCRSRPRASSDTSGPMSTTRARPRTRPTSTTSSPMGSRRPDETWAASSPHPPTSRNTSPPSTRP